MKKKKIKMISIDSSKCTNISIIKFILAILVIFSHAFPISLGASSVDCLSKLTSGQISFGNLSVCLFLFFSGFLITRSLEHDDNFCRFFKKRMLRIIPPLVFVLLFTVFIVGPLFTEVSLTNYFTDISWLLYLVKNTFLITTHNIVGLFTSNPYYESVNGSLWTLPVEVLCYIVLYVSVKLGFISKKYFKYTLFIFLPVILLKDAIYQLFPIFSIVFPLFYFFYMGVLNYIYRDKIILSETLFIVSIILTLCAIKFNFYSFISMFTISYMAIFLSFYPPQFKVGKKKLFSLSYEIYLLAFLIQQIVVYLYGGVMNPYLNFIFSTLITIILAYLLNYINALFQEQIIKRRKC